MERNNDFRTKEIKKKFGYSHHEISLLNQNEYDELLKVEGNIENVHNELRTNYQQKEQNEMRKSDEKSEESLPSTSWLSYLTSWIY